MGARSNAAVNPPLRPGQSLVRGLDRLLSGFDVVAKGFVGLSLLGMALILFVGALGRYVFNFSFVGGEEASRLLMVWMTFIGSYVLIREQRHIIIDVLLRLLPKSVQRWFGIAIGTLGLVAMAYLGWYGGLLAERMLVGLQMSPVLPIPRATLHLSLPVGCFLMVLAFLHMLLSNLLDPENAIPLFVETEVEGN